MRVNGVGQYEYQPLLSRSSGVGSMLRCGGIYLSLCGGIYATVWWDVSFCVVWDLGVVGSTYASLCFNMYIIVSVII